jgi:hypothetical protein
LVWQRPVKIGKSFAPLANCMIRREHIKHDSDDAFEDSLVIWLQAGCWYADIRIYLETGEVYSGFGGVIWWQKPKLWFQHLLNISGSLSTQDIGEIALTQFGCYERGRFTVDGRKVCFEEKWIVEKNLFSRVFTSHQRGRLMGLEVQNDNYSIIVSGKDIKLFKRHGKSHWQKLYSSTSLKNFSRPTIQRPRQGWKLREVAHSKTL